LQAKKDRPVYEKGRIVAMQEVPDHRIRLEAVDRSCRILGAYAPQERETTSVSLRLSGIPGRVRAWMVEHGRLPTEEERKVICGSSESQKGTEQPATTTSSATSEEPQDVVGSS
jgi:hypothetical protein